MNITNKRNNWFFTLDKRWIGAGCPWFAFHLELRYTRNRILLRWGRNSGGCDDYFTYREEYAIWFGGEWLVRKGRYQL